MLLARHLLVSTTPACVDWAEIRVVLLYKGKGSDPYCLDNYRGLGIGAVLEKVLSLLMMKLLESFLTSTSSLHPSQGGFCPQRGPPEQTFTLSEAVRAALRARGVSPAFLCFNDIERAYDSIQHAKLWARCIEMGIGGRFLSTLQAMHAGKKAVLDINGELLGSQDIETGVLQGNPLSPLLFNFYIDALVRLIDELAATRGDAAGVPLPRVGADLLGPLPTALSSLDVLYSLFFADDGVLIGRDRATLQLMLDAVVIELGEICLLLNAMKTKVLIVPPLTATEAQYQAIKLEVSDAGGFTARGQPVRIVDEFLYFGACCGGAGIGSGPASMRWDERSESCICCAAAGFSTRAPPWLISSSMFVVLSALILTLCRLSPGSMGMLLRTRRSPSYRLT